MPYAPSGSKRNKDKTKHLGLKYRQKKGKVAEIRGI
jgi:hypothetical protein